METHIISIEDNTEQTGGVTVKEAKEIIKAGHPPMANKVVLVDFDGTLYPFGFMFDAPAPLPGAREAMRELKKQGYKVGIFTSRLSKKWLATVNQAARRHRYYIKAVCKRDGIPFDFMTAEKIPAEFYIDDKAIGFRNNWPEINDWLVNTIKEGE